MAKCLTFSNVFFLLFKSNIASLPGQWECPQTPAAPASSDGQRDGWEAGSSFSRLSTALSFSWSMLSFGFLVTKPLCFSADLRRVWMSALAYCQVMSEWLNPERSSVNTSRFFAPAASSLPRPINLRNLFRTSHSNLTCGYVTIHLRSGRVCVLGTADTRKSSTDVQCARRNESKGLLYDELHKIACLSRRSLRTFRWHCSSHPCPAHDQRRPNRHRGVPARTDHT